MTEHVRYEPRPESVGLPPRVFLYTLDQVAELLAMPLRTLRTKHVYFEGYSLGGVKAFLMIARNIAPPGDEKPDWRIAENELVRWMKFKHFRFHARGWVVS